MGPVQGVAGLEADDALELLRGEKIADLAGRQHQIAELLVLRLRKHFHFAADEERARIAVRDAGPRMVAPRRGIDAGVVLRLVPREDILQMQRADDDAAARS